MLLSKPFAKVAAVTAVVWLCTAIAMAQPGDTPARLLSSQPFVLSEEARAAKIDGKVVVSVTVDREGSVKDAKVWGGPAWPCSESPRKEISRVREAVLQNIRLAKFSPAVKNGRPQETDLWMTFSIGDIYKSAASASNVAPATDNDEAPRIVESGVVNGRALKLPPPAYPPSARASRLSGSISVDIVFDEEGTVIHAGTLGGHPILQESARDAACKARFQPLTLAGQPVKINGIIVYNFVPR